MLDGERFPLHLLQFFVSFVFGRFGKIFKKKHFEQFIFLLTAVYHFIPTQLEVSAKTVNLAIVLLGI